METSPSPCACCTVGVPAAIRGAYLGCHVTLVDSARHLDSLPSVGLGDISAVLSGAALDRGRIRKLEHPDPRRPYGRHVFLEGAQVEGMVATWTRAYPCAPHDHGGSVGGVRVLRGAALHRMYRLEGQTLSLAREERVATGGVVLCGPELIHSMQDAGDEEQLMTLHLYASPIEEMRVYDLASTTTYVVDGGCGAWVPVDEPKRIRRSWSGFARRM